MSEIEIDLMPDGTCRFTRGGVEINQGLFEIIKEISPSQQEAIKEFLDGSLLIKRLIGSENLCG